MTILELARSMVEAAQAKQLRIAVAESLTGGLLAATIVSVPGASQVFVGAVVAYDTAVKRELLGVSNEQLQETGPVDPLVAQQMAIGVARHLGAPVDIAVATTGVAGPDPDPQTGLGPGIFYVGYFSGAQQFAATGNREAVREAAVRQALIVLLDEIEAYDSRFAQ